MSDHTDLLIRAARAVELLATAEDYCEAADEALDTPQSAARVCWDAASSLRTISERFRDLADQQTFAAKRYDKAAREEARTGIEYRAGGEAA